MPGLSISQFSAVLLISLLVYILSSWVLDRVGFWVWVYSFVSGKVSLHPSTSHQLVFGFLSSLIACSLLCLLGRWPITSSTRLKSPIIMLIFSMPGFLASVGTSFQKLLFSCGVFGVYTLRMTITRFACYWIVVIIALSTRDQYIFFYSWSRITLQFITMATPATLGLLPCELCIFNL